jgi:hypothetical protein
MSDNVTGTTTGLVRAGPATDPAVRCLIWAAMLIGFGVWCWMDLSKFPYASPSKDINAFSKWATNHVGAVLPPLALWPLAGAIRHLRRRLAADDAGLEVDGRRIQWDDVAQLDASRFQSKGLLTLRLKDQSDLVLDAWHYRRDEFKQVVRVLEQKVPLVVGRVHQPANDRRV